MLLAKLTEPRSINPISRPRLFRLLDQAGNKPVTWVWAPPGSGKTTLVGSYLTSKKLRMLWFQMDSGDNDLATFFYYLGLGAPKRKRPMAMFTPEYQMGLPIFTRNFFRELFGRLKPPFALVFDNYQEIDGSSPLHEAIQDALAEVPTGGRVIFISRSEAPAPFAGLRARQLVEVIDWSELRFTRTELNKLVKRLAPGKWPKAAIDQLYETSDGWAAGLVLLTEQLRKDRSTKLDADGKSTQAMFDYFAGEIFKRTDPEIKEVLLRTALLPTVTVNMANQLTGMDTAGDVLARLHLQNYFTNRRLGDDPSYEYHPLFREFLLAEAKRAYPPQQLIDLYDRAAEIAKAVGKIETAAELYVQARDWVGLTALICSNATNLMGEGRLQTVERWITNIPEDVVDKIPWLQYWQGACWLGWKHNECRRSFEQALTAFRVQSDTAGMFLSWAGWVTSYQREGEVVPLELLAMLGELMQESPEFPSAEIECQVAATMIAQITLRQPDHPDGIQWAERALELARQQANQMTLAGVGESWFHYHWQLGDLQGAMRVLEDLRAIMRSKSAPPLAVIVAGLTVLWHESLSAEPHYFDTAATALSLVQHSGIMATAKYPILTAALVGCLSAGDIDTARPWLEELKQVVHMLPVGFAAFVHWVVTWDALIRRDWRLAEIHQPELLRTGGDDKWIMNQTVAHLMSAIVLHQQQNRGANQHIAHGLRLARKIRSPYVEFMARTVEAHIWFDNGEDARALESLRIAMELGRAGGFVNSQVWIPKIMARLCAKALEHNIEPEYARMLIKKRNLVPEEPPVDIESWPWPIRIFTLGQFQILKDEQPLQFSGKVQRKPLALLKSIIALGGHKVREDTLLDLLWPDADGDAARFALTSAIHRLRKLLGREQAIIRRDNEISLDDRHCWIDIWAMERMLDRSETLLSGNGDEAHWTKAMELLDKAIKLYQGPFLNNDPDIPSLTSSDRIRRRLLRQLAQLAQHWDWKDNFEKATALYEQAFNIDPCAEDICRKLMTAYHKLGRPAEAISIYNGLKTSLKNQLGIRPSVETERLWKKLSEVE